MNVLMALQLAAALFLMSGCVHVLSDEAYRSADPAVTFSELRQKPGPFLGKKLILGGAIAAVKNTTEGGQLEIVQFDLDSSGAPRDRYRSGGRFIASTPRFLDPVVYRVGFAVTIFGEVTGEKTLKLDEAMYTYPVVTIAELFIWESRDRDPAVIAPFFFPYPYPFPYGDPFSPGPDASPYWYSPYGYRPLGPAIGP